MKRSVVSVVLVMLLGLLGSADGAIITNVESIDGLQGLFQSGGGGVIPNPDSSSSDFPLQDFYHPGNDATQQWVWMTADVTNLNEPFGPEIDVFQPTGAGATTYAFRVTVTNNTGKPIAPMRLEFSNVGGLSPANFNLITFTPLSFHNWDGVDETSFLASLTNQYHSTWNSQFVTLPPNELLFGGLNGGGGQLLPGQTGDIYFGITFGEMTNFAAGAIQLNLIPSPEPTSLMLGAFGLIGGVLLVRRRRNKKAAQDVQPQA